MMMIEPEPVSIPVRTRQKSRVVLTRVWYLRLATLLPLLLPFPMQAVLRGSALVGARVPDWFGNATMMAGMGLVLFGPVYVIVVGGILLILRRRS